MNYNGLNENEILKNREKYGKNIIEEKEPPSILSRVIGVLTGDLIMYLLIGLTVIMGVESIIERQIPYESIALIITLGLITFASVNSDIQAYKEYKALKKSIKIPLVTVIRSGVLKQVKLYDLVVGDLVLLESGQKSYADCIVIESDNVKVNNSDINGESEEVKLRPIDGFNIDFDKKPNINLQNFIHSNAVITDGKCKAVVVRVGANTESGLAMNIDEIEIETPLTTKINNLTKNISIMGYSVGVIIFLILMYVDISSNGGVNEFVSLGVNKIIKGIIASLMLSLSIVASAVPEGLPLMKVSVLNKNAKKMKDNNVLVRNKDKCETPGSISTLFSDKTGTITKGELEVVEFFNGNLEDTRDHDIIKNMLALSIGRNTSSDFDENNNIINGNATDKALLNFLGRESFKESKTINIIKQQLFNSKNKFSSAQLSEEVDNITVYKGASEKLLEHSCAYINKNGIESKIDKSKVLENIDKLANRSMRVLAFGYSKKPLVEDEINDDLVIIGFVGIRDEVRPSSKKAIETVQKAGVKVTMITGDKKETAVAIAKEVGLIKSEDDLVFTNDELEAMSDDEIKKILPKIRVIARAMPKLKRRIAKLAQENGEVVGMTGDGVNDAPALKQADIGFAMGSGTEVAKESGDIIILDDNFESIAYSILSGRTIYKNIQKFLKFQLAINVGMVATSILSPLLGITQPLSVVNILFINLIMDTLASLSLCCEPSEDYYMKEAPIDRNDNILNKEMILQIVASGGYFIIGGLALLFNPTFLNIFKDTSLTAYFTFFVLTSVFNGFNVRNHSLNIFKGLSENRDFIKIMSLITLIQVLLVNFGGKLFNCIPMNLTQWLIITLISIMIIPVGLIVKLILGGNRIFNWVMKDLEGKTVTIEGVENGYYFVKETHYHWTDEMLEPIKFNTDKFTNINIIQNGNTTIAKMNNKEGYAVCNPQLDKYNEKEGIRIAVCRLLDIKPFKEEKKIEEYSVQELLDELAKRCK